LCNDSGVVIRCFGDGLGISNRYGTKQSMLNLVSSRRQQKITDFLRTIRDRRTAFGWEMELRAGERRTLLFHGCVTPGGILVLITPISDATDHTVDSAVAAAGHQPAGRKTEAHAVVSVRSAEAPAEVPGEAPGSGRAAEPLPLTSHDLKNVIISVVSAAEFLIDYTSENLTEQQHELVRRIKASAEVLMAVSEQVFKLGRPEDRAPIANGLPQN
jgi:hypothetical protein